jgi:hypothetical protein
MEPVEADVDEALAYATASEVSVAGEARPMIVWGLSYDRENYLRTRHYPRAVRVVPIVDLSDVADLTYPGTYGLDL